LAWVPKFSLGSKIKLGLPNLAWAQKENIEARPFLRDWRAVFHKAREFKGNPFMKKA
jgi:hypothetical protein